MAILGKNGISTSLVGATLGTNSRDVGTLCTNPDINIWSKWKPIESKVDTMTLDELINQNYGITVLSSNNITELIKKINSSLGIGYIYNRAKTKFRLGDFRNYDTNAPIPCERTYLDEEVIKVGGVTADNHSMFERLCGGIESMSTETTLGVDDIYNLLDDFGKKVELRRGCYITDGNIAVWYTDKFYWWTNEMQYFGGKDVTIYEFYTNVIRGSDGVTRHPGSDSTGSWTTDRFFALPYPRYSKHIENQTPIGSKLVSTVLSAKFADRFGASSKIEDVSWGVYFSAIGDEYKGGTLDNVWIKLCRDKEGYDVIEALKLADTLSVPKDTKSRRFTGIFKNKPETFGGTLSASVWVIVWYNYKIQAQLIPMMVAPDIQH